MFTIRKATTEDIPLIHKMAQEVFVPEYYLPFVIFSISEV